MVVISKPWFIPSLAYKNLMDIFIVLSMTHKPVVDKNLYTH